MGRLLLFLLLAGCSGLELCPELGLRIQPVGGGTFAVVVDGVRNDQGLFGNPIVDECQLFINAQAVDTNLQAQRNLWVTPLLPGDIITAECGGCSSPAVAIR